MQNLEIVQAIITGLKQALELKQIPVFVFDRISDKPQESKSLEFQDAHSKRYVKEKNLFAVYHFSVTESGWSSKDRHIFKQMLDLSEKFGIKNLVFKNTDRLSRNLTDLLRIQGLIENKGYRIHFFESYKIIEKGSTYDDKFNLTLLIILAQRLSDKISHDMRASNKYKVERHIAPGRARLGYVYDKEKRIHMIDKTKEAEIRWLFDEFDSGKHSLSDFVDLVNAKGIKNLFDRKWGKSRLHEFLTNPFYHGEFITRTDGLLHTGNHEPYYGKERFQKRVQRLGARYFPRKEGGRNFLLSNLLRCTCGAKYYGDLKKGKYVYYEHPCKHLGGKSDRLKEAELFQQIDSEIARMDLTDDSTAALKAIFSGRIKERNSNSHEDLLLITNKLMELSRKKSKLFELYTEDGIDKQDLTARIQEYEKEIVQLRKREQALSIDQKDFVFQVSQIIEDFKNFPRTYALFPKENKAKMLRDSVEQIVRDGGKIRIEFHEEFRILYRPELLALGQAVRVCHELRGWRDSNP